MRILRDGGEDRFKGREARRLTVRGATGIIPGIMGVPDRADIQPGVRVNIVQKNDQGSGRLTQGVVRDILTSSPVHPHGIKVRLTTGEVGRVKEILPSS
jgi:uncharacterized repeat protein (TIGR03833 family)